MTSPSWSLPNTITSRAIVVWSINALEECRPHSIGGTSPPPAAGATSFYLSTANAALGYVSFASTLPPPVGVYNVLGFRWKDGVVDQFLNDFNIGNAVNTTLSPTNGNTNLRIGRRQDGAVQLIGNVAEILIYKPSLGDAALSSVVNDYLRPKYGLTFDQPPVVSISSPATGTKVGSQV